MKIHIHQTHHTIGDFNAILATITEVLNSKMSGLHLFPELFLTGYPLQDLVFEQEFIQNYLALLEKINELSLKNKASDEIIFLLDGPQYFFENNEIARVENSIFEFRPGQKLKAVYSKRLLPNYDIFDEKKYFTAGTRGAYIEFQTKKIGLSICEDMWPSFFHGSDPIQEFKQELVDKNIQLDLFINLSGSPYNIKKQQKRIGRAKEISKIFNTPFIYVNRVGLEDEIIFDGQSFVVEHDLLVHQCKKFKSDTFTYTLNKLKSSSEQKVDHSHYTFSSLFAENIEYQNGKLPVIPSLTDADCEELLEAMKFGLQDYAKKCGFKNFLVALSGGIDSSLVLAIAKLSLKEGQSIEAIFMPSQFTTTLSFDLALGLAKNLGIKLYQFPIKFLHSTVRNNFKDYIKTDLVGLADENIQSRLRGNILYARSNQTNAMVINTSNKSELSVGYSTLYGDSVGAMSLIGDLYKTEVFEITEYINKLYPGLIPQEIITRPPSAELRDDQKDEDSLPAYIRLDPMLEGITSLKLSRTDLIQKGFNAEEVNRVYRLFKLSEYKRKQFCPVLKLKSKSFGFGHRMPICQKF